MNTCVQARIHALKANGELKSLPSRYCQAGMIYWCAVLCEGKPIKDTTTGIHVIKHIV